MIYFKKFLKMMQAFILVIGMQGLLSSCAHVEEPEPDPVPWLIDEEVIKHTSVGMTIEDVFHYCGARLIDIPIIRYSAKRGAYYSFYFLPTNEVNWLTLPQNGEVTLVAVTLKHPKTKREYYVLPDSVKGEIFTGIKPVEQWGK